MDTQQIESIREDLLARKTRIEREIESLESDMAELGDDFESDGGGQSNHMAEGSASATEQERLLTLAGDLRGMLNQINEALERIEDGTYGICQRCGKQINPERLEAFPYVAYCIDCQAIIEREQRRES
jgi:RNA polymerase-binding protein DksA